MKFRPQFVLDKKSEMIRIHRVAISTKKRDATLMRNTILCLCLVIMESGWSQSISGGVLPHESAIHASLSLFEYQGLVVSSRNSTAWFGEPITNPDNDDSLTYPKSSTQLTSRWNSKTMLLQSLGGIAGSSVAAMLTILILKDRSGTATDIVFFHTLLCTSIVPPSIWICSRLRNGRGSIWKTAVVTGIATAAITALQCKQLERDIDTIEPVWFVLPLILVPAAGGVVAFNLL